MRRLPPMTLFVPSALLRQFLLGAAVTLTVATPQIAAAQRSLDPVPQRRFAPNEDTARDSVIVQAREALRRNDRRALDAAQEASRGHELAGWVAYWALSSRLATATQADVDAFYAAWRDTYVEDRLRNDWLLELGRRQDWANFAKDHPTFRMQDDREVQCYHLLLRHRDGEDVTRAAREAWFGQREAGDGCHLLARTLTEAGRFTAADAWTEVRLSVEANRPRAARLAAALVSPAAERAVNELLEQPARALQRHESDALGGLRAEVAMLALMRAAANDPEFAAGQLQSGLGRRLPSALASHAWAFTGRQAALRGRPEAVDHYREAFQRAGRGTVPWSDDTLAWAVRAFIRLAPEGRERWTLVQRAVESMSDGARQNPAWRYWEARALAGRAAGGAAGEDDRATARARLQALAGGHGFYPQLAAEDLGLPLTLPEAPQPLSAEERQALRDRPGFSRALRLIALGLRNEGVREWNYTLRGLGDRELLAAAQIACDRQVWDRCINTSERSRGAFDVQQRFPLVLKDAVGSMARDVGVDPAFVLGLIRQESRFVPYLRSHVGASGLMQLMPATAAWTARRAGVAYQPERINDPDLNLLLGGNYLKYVLDQFDGAQALAAAAYNAGPSRPARWRQGATVEAAAWVEAIPFDETRDYVQKVLSNATVYALLIGRGETSLKARLGPPVGPRTP